MNQQKPKETNKNGENETVRRNPLVDLPEWLDFFFWENLVDESVPARRDAPAISSGYRVGTVFSLTSRKNQIVTSA